MLRDGDTLKITRLDRLGRSVLHLVTLGAELRKRGDGLHVIEHHDRSSNVPRTTVYGHLDPSSKGKRPAGQRQYNGTASDAAS